MTYEANRLPGLAPSVGIATEMAIVFNILFYKIFCILNIDLLDWLIIDSRRGQRLRALFREYSAYYIVGVGGDRPPLIG